MLQLEKVIRRYSIPVILLIMVITFGPLHLPKHDFAVPAEWRLLSGQFVAVGLLGALLIAHLTIPPIRTDTVFHCTRRAIFMTSLAMLGAWYWALYPGVIIGADTSIMLSSVVGQDGYNAYSAFWNNFFGGLYALTGSLQVIPIFNMVLCAWTIANLLALTEGAGIDRYFLALIVFLLFFFPVLPSSALLWSHDTTAALLRLAIVSYAIWLCRILDVSRMHASFGSVFILSVLSAACALTRSENLLLLVIVPCVMVYFRAFSRRTALASFIISALTIVLFSTVIERHLYRNESKIDYSLSLLANPARYFYNNDFVSATRANDLALLEKVYDRDWLRGTRFPYAPYHTKGLVLKPIDETTIRSLRSTLLSIAKQNPALVVQNRAILAWTVISGAPGADYHALNSSFDMNEQIKALYLNANQTALYDTVAKSAQYRPENLYWVAQRIHTYFDPRREHRPVLATLVWTLIPALACLSISLAGLRGRHLAAIPSLILLPCLAAVLLTAPAAHFKYLADVHVMGWFLPLLWYAEHNRQKSASDRPTPSGDSSGFHTDQPD